MTDVKNTDDNPVWHRMLYNCTHMATVGVKGLRLSLHVAFVVIVVFMYAHMTDFCDISDLKFRIKHKNELNFVPL